MQTTRHALMIAIAVVVAALLLPSAASAQRTSGLATMVQHGFDAYQQGNWSEAETVFRQVCGAYEDAGAPWGWCHMMLGTVLAQPSQGADKRQEALAQLGIAKELVTEDADRYRISVSVANIHLLDHDWAAALAAAAEAEPFADGEQAGALAKLKGQAYYQSGDYANAAKELEVAVAKRPDEALLPVLLGRSYFEIGDNANALVALTRALELDGNNFTALFVAGRINLVNSDFTAAVGLAERALQARPQHVGTRILLGSAYLGADRYADAAHQFEIVVESRPDDGTAIYNLGRAYSGMEDGARAIEQFQRARALLPPASATLGDLLFDLGVAFEAVGRHAEALAAYRDSVAIADDVKKQDAIGRVEEHLRRGGRSSAR